MADADKDKFMQLLNHFTSEVMERAMGLGDRYTTMDSVPSPQNVNNAMIGSLIPKKVIIEMNPKEKRFDENTGEFEIDYYDEEELSDYVNDHYYFDIFLTEDTSWIPLEIELNYWTPPTSKNKLPSEPYALRKDQNSPITYEKNADDKWKLNWNKDKFSLPFTDKQNVGKKVQSTNNAIDDKYVEIISSPFKIISQVLEDNYGKFQRISLHAISDPLLYPTLNVKIKDTKGIGDREFQLNTVHPKTGNRVPIENLPRIWYREGRCQVVPLDTINLKEEREKLEVKSNNLFISPIAIYQEMKTASIEDIVNLSMKTLFQDPFHGVIEITDFMKDNGWTELAQEFEKNVEAIRNDSNAIQSLKAVNLTYYNYFKNDEKPNPKWRLFQWSYLLNSFGEILNKVDLSDRFDFLGVRTGGGKSEAYISLTLASGFYSFFKGDTPESITLVRFPRRTLVIDQYQRVISVFSWANLVIRYYSKALPGINIIERPWQFFTSALLLGNEGVKRKQTIPYSPASVRDLYPDFSKSQSTQEEYVSYIGTYGKKGLPGTQRTRNKTEKFDEDYQNTDVPWTEDNIIYGIKEFINEDYFTPAAHHSYPIQNCPLCSNKITGEFNIDELRPKYTCSNEHHDLHIPNDEIHSYSGEFELYMFRTDEELVRYRPSMVMGTLDKLPHILINSIPERSDAFLGAFGFDGYRCENHGFYSPQPTKRKRARCSWKQHQGKIIKSKFINCKNFEKKCGGKRYQIIVHDEIHMFDDVVGGLNSPYERAFLKQLGKHTKVIGMSATLSNIADVAENLCDRHNKFIFPPPFFFKEEEEISRLHIGGLISVPREKRQFKTMHFYTFQVLQTWLNSEEQRTSDLARSDVYFKHPLLPIEPIVLETREIKPYLDLICRWVGYVRKKPNGEILDRDFDRGLEQYTKNWSKNYNDDIWKQFNESYYPFFGSISGDYPFNDLSNELEAFKFAIKDKKIPRALLTTNIFSVGMDIKGLSLIHFHGRPQKMAEYVQSSSRVGRGYPGLSFISFTPSELTARDHFSTFTRDLMYRYDIIEPSYFNPHSIGIVRETLLPIIRLLYKFKIDGIHDKMDFNDSAIEKALNNLYFNHKVKRGESIPVSSSLLISKTLKILEGEFNLNNHLIENRVDFITTPWKNSDKEVFNGIWNDINNRYEDIPIPKQLNVRSVGDQITIYSDEAWT